MIRLLLLFLFGPVMAVAQPAAEELQVIVERTEGELSFFLALPVDQMEGLLGTDLDLIFSDNGKLPLEDFQRDGSFELADDVFAAVKGQVDGRAVIFDPMSMMLHPNTTQLPFQDPFDGIMSTSVCGVFIAPEDQVPERMTAYYGGIFLNVPPNAPVQLTFPTTGRAAITVNLRQYDDRGFVGETMLELKDGGVLVLAEPHVSQSYLWLFYAVGLLLVPVIKALRQRKAPRVGLC